MTQQAAELRYAVHFKVVLEYFGQLSLIISALASFPLAVSLILSETHISLRYTIAIFGLVVSTAVLARLQLPERVQVNGAMVLTASLFLATPLVMTYPMMAGGLSFVEALFKSISGGTTTGLSTVATLESASSTFLFTRAWMQWYGGLGIVVFSLALAIRPGLAAKGLAVTEIEQDDLVLV